jgi:hypothetical protein
MKSPSTTPVPPAAGKGGGYTLGPRKPAPIPATALWITSNQTRDRYGGRSQMWLHRKLLDPDFPRPRYDGRLRLYSVVALDAYDQKILGLKTTVKMKSPPRNAAQLLARCKAAKATT